MNARGQTRESQPSPSYEYTTPATTPAAPDIRRKGPSCLGVVGTRHAVPIIGITSHCQSRRTTSFSSHFSGLLRPGPCLPSPLRVLADQQASRLGHCEFGAKSPFRRLLVPDLVGYWAWNCVIDSDVRRLYATYYCCALHRTSSCSCRAAVAIVAAVASASTRHVQFLMV